MKPLHFSFLLTLLGGSSQGFAETSPSRPNIVMIFTDDQRADAVGYIGNTAIHTPNLDRLAKEGLVFTNCYVNTSICAVSRANLLSGQYPHRHGIDDFFKTFSAAQFSRSVPARLRAAGYQTAFFGKWGIGDTAEKTHLGAGVFDYWAGQPKQSNFFHDADCRYVHSDGFQRPVNNLCDCPADSRGKAGIEIRIGKANLTDPVHVDAVITPAHVRRFLEGRDSRKPFFMALHFKGPHSPWTDWDPEMEGVTQGKQMPIPASATQENADHEPDVVKKSLGAGEGKSLLGNSKRHEQSVRDYYRSISSLDLGVARILAQLEERGLTKNTVILFTSDNGHFSGEHGLGGKWLMYEPSLRVPGFLHDPRRPVATSSDRMVITTDFSATILALAGLRIPHDFSGLDLTRLLADPHSDWRADFLYSHPYSHNGVIPRTLGVRSKQHVYTRYLDPKPDFEQLFDLEKDPEELHNLTGSPEFAGLLKQLRARTDELYQQTGPASQGERKKPSYPRSVK